MAEPAGEGEKSAAHRGDASPVGKDDVQRSDRKTADSPDFGVEGTNKTLPEPEPNAQPSGELTGAPTKHIADSPYKSRTI
ncbi:MAG: hypothetical protein JWP47_1159 [Polaromonas sp.]|nr:hypothetical protein [Polaromonas sp.]